MIPLFKVEKGEPEPEDDAVVTVEHKNETYWVRGKGGCSATLTVLSFLTQVQGLFQSEADFPASQQIFSFDR